MRTETIEHIKDVALDTLRDIIDEQLTRLCPEDVALESEEFIYECLREAIDNHLIYYKTCIDIVKEYRYYDWEDLAANFGQINSIGQLASYILLEDIDNEGIYQEIKNEIQDYILTKQN